MGSKPIVSECYYNDNFCRLCCDNSTRNLVFVFFSLMLSVRVSLFVRLSNFSPSTSHLVLRGGTKISRMRGEPMWN